MMSSMRAVRSRDQGNAFKMYNTTHSDQDPLLQSMMDIQVKQQVTVSSKNGFFLIRENNHISQKIH